jgi:hypothetical protein
MQKDPTQRFRHSYSQKKDVVLLGDPFLGRVAQSTPCFLTCAKLWWFLCFSFFLFKLIYVSPLFSVFSICKFFGTSVWTYDINWHQLTLTSVDLSHGTWLHQGRNSFPPLPPESVSIGRQPIRRSLWSRGLKGSAAKLCRLNAFFQVLDVMCFWCWVTRVKILSFLDFCMISANSAAISGTLLSLRFRSRDFCSTGYFVKLCDALPRTWMYILGSHWWYKYDFLAKACGPPGSFSSRRQH